MCTKANKQLLSSPMSANHRGECGHPVPAIILAPYSVCVWDVLYTHQIKTEKLWTWPFCIWCMFKTLHISQQLWVPAVGDCVYNRQSLTTCNIRNIYSTNHAENNTLHKVPKHSPCPLYPPIFRAPAPRTLLELLYLLFIIYFFFYVFFFILQFFSSVFGSVYFFTL